MSITVLNADKIRTNYPGYALKKERRKKIREQKKKVASGIESSDVRTPYRLDFANNSHLFSSRWFSCL